MLHRPATGLSRVRVPQPGGSIIGCSHHALPVRAELRRSDGAGMAQLGNGERPVLPEQNVEK
jgi:hypothetical protein